MGPGYQALRESAAWLDLSSRGIISASGEDRARLLHAMSTNQVKELAPGQGCYVFFLNPQGRIVADANLLILPDRILIDVGPPGAVDSIYAHKPSVIWHEGALYHFYCAVSGNHPNEVRGISIARSRPFG